MEELSIKGSEISRWDCVSLGEVMLRLDPGEGRIHTARQFQAWEGGGEYNVARGLRRCFGMRTTIATAFADNPIGRLVEDFILQGGVDTSLIRWVPMVFFLFVCAQAFSSRQEIPLHTISLILQRRAKAPRPREVQYS